MFFDKQYDTTIIDNTTINEKYLPERWAKFAYTKGIENGLSEMYSVNFGYNISSFIAGMGVDAGTDVYFKLDLDDAIFDIYEDCKNSSSDDVECLKQFFNKLLEFYKADDGICLYEKAVFHHNVRVSCELKKWFEQQGQSAKKTIFQLLDNSIEKPCVTSSGKDCNLTFKLTYSEQECWNGIPGVDGPSKIHHLLM